MASATPRLRAATSWMFGGQTIRAALQLGYFVVIARALGASGLGTFVALLAITSAVMPFASLGFGNVLVMRTARDRDALPECWGNALLTTAFCGSILLAGLAGVGSFFVPGVGVTTLVAVGAAEFYFNRISDVAVQAFQAVEQMPMCAALSITTNGLRFCAALGFAATAASPAPGEWAVWYLGATMVGASVAVTTVSRSLGKPAIGVRNIFGHSKDGAYFSISFAATTIYTDIDKMMLARLSSLTAAGSYAAAYRVVGTAFIPITAILLAAYPKFFNHGSKGVRATSKFARRLMRVAVPYCVGAGVAIAASAPLVPHVLGSDFSPAVSTLRWLAPLPLLQAVYYFGADALTGAGHQRVRTVIQFFAAAANILLNIWLIADYGAKGAAWSTLITYFGLALGVWTATVAARGGSKREGGDTVNARPSLAG